MARNDSNDDYNDKRDFDRTPEPEHSGGDSNHGEDPRFVIQKHDASSLHYDIRLEIGGTLKSWAVPKGPSTDPSEKRLAIPTEDHPLDYAGFEGTIPEDQYGGGTVLIWDRGTFDNLTEKDGDLKPLKKAWEDGHLLVGLHGEKVRGGYAFQRTGSGDDANWLMIKMDDDEADARRKPTSTEPKSVASGRSLDEIASENEDDE